MSALQAIGLSLDQPQPEQQPDGAPGGPSSSPAAAAAGPRSRYKPPAFAPEVRERLQVCCWLGPSGAQPVAQAGYLPVMVARGTARWTRMQAHSSIGAGVAAGLGAAGGPGALQHRNGQCACWAAAGCHPPMSRSRKPAQEFWSGLRKSCQALRPVERWKIAAIAYRRRASTRKPRGAMHGQQARQWAAWPRHRWAGPGHKASACTLCSSRAATHPSPYPQRRQVSGCAAA